MGRKEGKNQQRKSDRSTRSLPVFTLCPQLSADQIAFTQLFLKRAEPTLVGVAPEGRSDFGIFLLMVRWMRSCFELRLSTLLQPHSASLMDPYQKCLWLCPMCKGPSEVI